MTARTSDESQPAGGARYEPAELERGWQRRWEQDALYATPDHVEGRENWYALTMFPYTSGDLHIGHWFAMAPSDAAARFRRMQGYNVLFPMGFDAFGLPAENAAIRGQIHPRDWTMANIERMRGQLKRMGAMFDWRRELNTSAPDYYRWTQWWFLQLYRQGLAYRAEAPVNWCPSCNTTLANEQVVDGACERCDTAVEQRRMAQWFFRITRYAEQLLGHEGLQWPEYVKLMQRNWIGRSEGAEVSFALERPAPDGTAEIRVFTTRPDTLCGVTFMVLAPEHPLVEQITTDAQRAAVRAYVEATKHATEIERQSTEREKSGVFTGAYSVNRITGERVPVWIADYALLTYGTGAVMGVPAHDQRDFEFARRFALPVRVVIAPPGWDGAPLVEAYLGPGVMVHSGRFDGLPNEQGKGAIAQYAELEGWGGPRIAYRLRDWLISRQRYWGAPIPMLYCEQCGIVPVPEQQLPVELPYDVEFRPTGQSPLALSERFVRTSCPQCGRAARRETDTLDTFMCSSWYFMRYADPHNRERAVGDQAAQNWLPVDQYTGGSEHATMHLLYARFFYKAARDAGLVPGDEPFTRLFSQGQILGPDGRRMSKSRGNVVAPDAQVEHWGADAFRAYLMFLGPWEQGGPYDVDGIVGVSRWLHRLWALITQPPRTVAAPVAESIHGPLLAQPPRPVAAAVAESPRELRRLAHRTLQRVTSDLEHFQLNTMIAALMEMTNGLQRLRDAGPVDAAAWEEGTRLLLLMLAPSCPHLAEELWAQTGRPYSIHQQPWPAADPELARRESVEIAVQVNGRTRGRLTVAADADEAAVRAEASGHPAVRDLIAGKTVERVIYVPERLLNLVVR
ncbi:MAG: leucine--tRNA ligase [Dehalococcoidia bacterium]|nr:leucine--tRNA ligase [Dehalococcoidia bacterium]